MRAIEQMMVQDNDGDKEICYIRFCSLPHLCGGGGEKGKMVRESKGSI